MCAAERDGHRSSDPATRGEGVTAARLTALLGAFGPGDALLGVSELARRTGMPKSSAHRLIGHLVREGLLEREPNGVRLGIRLFEIGQLAAARRGLVDAARPYLADLREASRNTVHLAVLEGIEVVYLDIVRGPDAPALPSRVGGRFPAHATAVGKAILAHSPGEVLETVISAGLPRIGPRTLTAPGLLRRQLSKVCEEGIAYEHEESAPGVVCVAGPVLDRSGRARAAVSISGWSNRVRAERVAPAVRTTALTLSRTLP